jgi:hypothetical protein
LRDGAIANKYLLRTRYRAIHADVYLSAYVEPNLQQRISAAWLWTHRQGVIAGLSAAALHGAKWVDDRTPVELECSAATRNPDASRSTGPR